MTILSKQGYIVNKKNISKDQVETIKNDLTVTPKVMPGFGTTAESFEVFKEDDDSLYLPRYYGTKKFSKPDKDELYTGRKIDIKFNGSLRDYQLPIAKLIQDRFHSKETKGGGGLLCLPCGRGKTIIAIKTIVDTGVKTIVVVHKEFLMRQWKRQIERFTNARVGIIQRDVVDIKDKDVVLAMLKSVSIKEYNKKIFEEFGLVIVDECHHIAAKIYSRSLPKIACRYTLGLSATPTRIDGLSKIFYWYMGDIIYKEELRQNESVNAKFYKFTSTHHLFKQIYNFRREVNRERMVTNLTTIPERNKLILELINERRKRGNYCKMLILGRRKEHLKFLKSEMDKCIINDKRMLKRLYTMKKHIELDIDTPEYDQELMNIIYDKIDIYEKASSQETAFYLGGMKEKDLTISEKKDIIFGTYDMAEEGLDIESLNTIVLVTPKRNVVQSVGRILRMLEYEVNPEIIDISDQLQVFVSQAMARESYYKKSKYNVFKYKVVVEYSKDKIDPKFDDFKPKELFIRKENINSCIKTNKTTDPKHIQFLD
jgi:superfamily II DNA or RNA helicase